MQTTKPLIAALLFALCSFTPASAQAQDTTPSSADALSEPVAEAEADLVLVVDRPPLPEAEAEEPAPSTGARIGAEILGGVVGLAAAVGVNAGTVHRLMQRENCGEDFGMPCVDEAAIATTALLAFGYTPAIATGVWVGGKMAGGHGRHDFTLLGGTVGNALGWGMIAGLAASDDERLIRVGLALLPVLQLAGSIIGYELSSSAEADNQRERARVAPTFAADANGAVVGLAGTF